MNESYENIVLKSSSIDSFLIGVKSSLGYLNHLTIWHDNSGTDENASWFLKYIIVYDLQTKEKFYTICENWLAVEKGDGKIERSLVFRPQYEFKQLKMKNETIKEKLADIHLWYSVFNRPIGSLFTRLNRVTCCFLAIYTSMLLITVYYSKIDLNEKSSFTFNIGVIDFTQEQVIEINYFKGKN